MGQAERFDKLPGFDGIFIAGVFEGRLNIRFFADKFPNQRAEIHLALSGGCVLQFAVFKRVILQVHSGNTITQKIKRFGKNVK